MPSVEAWARWAAEKASLTKMSPSAASWLAKSGSFFSSPAESGCFPAAAPRHPSAPSRRFRPPARRNPRRRQPGGRSPRPAAGTTGFSDMDGTTLPLGRSKWLSTITRAPLSANSRMVGAWRAMRGGVGHLAVGHRHIEVGAQQHALALDIQPVERAELHLDEAFPSPRRYPPCGWRSPIHCRTRPSPRRRCRPSPWSGPARRKTKPDCG